MTADDTPQAQAPVARYAVFGKPVQQSLSPRIHALFAAQTGQSLEYTRCEIDDKDFEARVSEFFAGGGSGLNITLPYKQRAAAMARVQSEPVALAGAANTLFLHGGELHAENTDGMGLVNDLLANLGWPVAGGRVLVIGAGGAVRGVLAPLLDCRPTEIVLANRTQAKAAELAAHFSAKAKACSANISWQPLAALQGNFDLVINGSSAGLGGAVPAIPVGVVDGARCYDMVYGTGAAPFLAWAGRAGARSLADGLGMLVEQAAAAFFIWRGVKPATRPVIDALREAL